MTGRALAAAGHARSLDMDMVAMAYYEANLPLNGLIVCTRDFEECVQYWRAVSPVLVNQMSNLQGRQFHMHSLQLTQDFCRDQIGRKTPVRL